MATQPTPIGLVLPITNGNRGYFEQAFDSFTQKRMNLINLLRTRPGERRFQPTFGTRLWNVVFDQNSTILKDVITKTVTEDVAQWIDGVIIQNVSIQVPQETSGTTPDLDIYSVLITVTFQDTATQQTGNIQVMVNGGTV
jgi:phage baseplate assembly protein W